MNTGRQSFDALLAGRAGGRPAWIPLVDEVAPRVAATSYRELSTDPGLWTAGLLGATELLGADALVAGFDFTLAAEACGAELAWSGPRPVIVRPPAEISSEPLAAPRQAALLETLRRLGATAHTHIGLVAALIGPATLALQLCPDLPLEDGLRRVRTAHTAMAEAVLKARPDLILFIERPCGTGLEPPRAWQRAFATLRNLAGYYAVPTAMYLEGWTMPQLAGLATLQMGVYWLGEGEGDALSAARVLAVGPTGVGVPVPGPGTGGAREVLDAVRAAREDGRNLFLTTAGVIGGQEDLAGLCALATELHEVAA